MNRPHLLVVLALSSLAVTVSACSAGSTAMQSITPAGPTGPTSSSSSTNPVTQPSSAPNPVTTPGPVESNPTGDIPDNQAYVVYRGISGLFSFVVPEGWARTISGSSASFTDKLNTVSANQLAAASSPTIASVTATELKSIVAGSSGFALGGLSPFTTPSGAGIRLTYVINSAPDPVTNKVVRDARQRFIFWKAGQQVDLTLSGPQTADNVDPWAKVVASFRWTR